MMRLDHLVLRVRDADATRDWYATVLGLAVEFDRVTPRAVGLVDDHDVTLILTEDVRAPSDCSLFFQVDDVAATHARLVDAGIDFVHGPQGTDWGYGAALSDPDGRLVGLWDQTSLQAHMAEVP